MVRLLVNWHLNRLFASQSVIRFDLEAEIRKNFIVIVCLFVFFYLFVNLFLSERTQSSLLTHFVGQTEVIELIVI